MKKIVFAHGLQGSPDGEKATYLRERLGATAPWLGGLRISEQVRVLVDAVGADGPAVVVGSSLGGLAALGLASERPDLVHRLVLLAPAVGMEKRAHLHPDVEAERPGLFSEAAHFSALSIPAEIKATVIHGLADEFIETSDVLSLVIRSPSARLILVHDDHSLHGSRDLILFVASEAASRASAQNIP